MQSFQSQRVVDVLLQLRSSHFEPCFTYAVPAEYAVGVGAVVQVSLGKRSHYGYVLSEMREQPFDERIKYLEPCTDIPIAFSADTLALAQWLADYYCCTLSEALATMVTANALPRTRERIVPGDQDLVAGVTSIPERFVSLLWGDFPQGVALEEFLRHPEARRTADRPTLRRILRACVELGAVELERRQLAPAIRERTMRILQRGDQAARGKKATALQQLILAQGGELPTQDALAQGFSRALILQGVRTGALREVLVPAPSAPRPALLAPSPFTPTPEQSAAIGRLLEYAQRDTFVDVLMHGITGSGKTLVYLEFLRVLVERGESAIVLVPEIALTPQTAKRFEAIFGTQVVVLHSALSERERFERRQAAAAGEVRVVVGARSAVFTPLPRLRAIIIDEAHETSYKQDVTPRYHAITVARERMRRMRGILILGSATPPLEEYARAKLGRAELITLEQRATQLPLPRTHVVDMSKEPRNSEDVVFSLRLLGALEACLHRGDKAVLFVNRRGSANFLLCRACAFVPRCRRCSLSLTYHASEGLLRCHLCDAQEPVRDRCPRCGQTPFKALGIGTERVARELATLFPHAHITRMDSDTTTRVGDHARLLAEFEREGDILVGTQMIAKGLDFEAVTLAAVLAADIGLHHADYRASERTFDLLTQVAGRSGRSQAGEAIIQTYLPEHPAVAFAAQHDFVGFARGELAERRALVYPPFTKLAYVGVIGRDYEHVWNAARQVGAILREAQVGEVFGPAFYPVARVNHEWRLRIAVKAARYDGLRASVLRSIVPLQKKLRGVRVSINLDP